VQYLYNITVIVSFWSWQCLGLSEDELAQREVEHVDIVQEEVAEKHYKPEEVVCHGASSL
jgi:Phosphatidylinositol transfer protein